MSSLLLAGRSSLKPTTLSNLLRPWTRGVHSVSPTYLSLSKKVQNVLSSHGLKGGQIKDLTKIGSDHQVFRAMPQKDLKKIIAAARKDIEEQKAFRKNCNYVACFYAAVHSLVDLSIPELQVLNPLFFAYTCVAAMYSTNFFQNYDENALAEKLQALSLNKPHSSLPKENDEALRVLYTFFNSPSSSYVKQKLSLAVTSHLDEEAKLISDKDLTRLIELCKEAKTQETYTPEQIISKLHFFPSMTVFSFAASIIALESLESAMGLTLIFSYFVKVASEKIESRRPMLEKLLIQLEEIQSQRASK